jgi:hypothetical protein
MCDRKRSRMMSPRLPNPESSASLMPRVRYSRMSETVVRVPRITGFPPRISGSSVIRSSRFDKL